MKEATKVQGWKYYNHAMIPTCAPHEEPDLTPIQDGSIWKVHKGGTPVLARWTTDWDCGYETEWWYVIKDTPFDITLLKAKRRYEIRRGEKYFDVKPIDPKEYIDALFEVQQEAFLAYPPKYRPIADREAFYKAARRWGTERVSVFGAFWRETGELCGYSLVNVNDGYLGLSVQKTKPRYEKYQISAALVYAILGKYRALLDGGCYIADGARNILHETQFQDYLGKYFGFRRAYCRLHVAYNPKYRWIICLAYPFRKLWRKFDGISIVHSLNAILKMEEIVRKQG